MYDSFKKNKKNKAKQNMQIIITLLSWIQFKFLGENVWCIQEKQIKMESFDKGICDHSQ